MPVKFPSNLVHSNASYPVIAAADQTIQGLFFVADTTERGNIPETKRVEGSIAVVGSTVEVYNGTGVSDATWQDVKNWVEVGGTATGADLDVVGVRASEFSTVTVGGQQIEGTFYRFEDNVNADSDTVALVFREYEDLIPSPADNQSFTDSSGQARSNVPILTFAIGTNDPLFNGGPPNRTTRLIHIQICIRIGAATHWPARLTTFRSLPFRVEHLVAGRTRTRLASPTLLLLNALTK